MTYAELFVPFFEPDPLIVQRNAADSIKIVTENNYVAGMITKDAVKVEELKKAKAAAFVKLQSSQTLSNTVKGQLNTLQQSVAIH